MIASEIDKLIKSRDNGTCMDVPMRDACKWLRTENKRLLREVCCLWCRHKFKTNMATKEGRAFFFGQMMEHLLVCKKHPLAKIANQQGKRIKQLLKALDVTYKAYKAKCTGEKYSVKQIRRVHKLAKELLTKTN